MQRVTSPTSVGPTTLPELIEREAAMDVLEKRLRSAAGGTGHTVFIGGEAGVGKTSLLKKLAAQRRGADLWWGNCDALETPHPLAPLHDVARSAAVCFGPLLASNAGRSAVFEALLAELQQSPRPILMVIEDAHWADAATLDLVKFLGRRVDRAPCLFIVSYRDDEVSVTHPLRRVLGELPSSLVTRLDLNPLSPDGVEVLARRALRSADGLYSTTQGNPFFITELLRHGADGVPRSVRDLVLARFARLSTQAQVVVQIASVVPAKIERWLIDQLISPTPSAIEECINSGLLMASADGSLAFRHELARVAVETSMSEPIARRSHGQILNALLAGGEPSASLARIVHHATHAGDTAAMLHFAPAAAREAQQRGAHREAAAHLKTALEHSRDAQQIDRTAWLDAYAEECQLTDHLNEAIDARMQLGALFQRAGNAIGEAQNLSKLALVHVLALRNHEADTASRRAIELLESQPPGSALASAYRVEAQLRMLNRDCDESVGWANRAIELAQQVGDRGTVTAAYNTLGAAMLFIDYEQACAHLQHALELALSQQLHYIASNIYTNLGSGAGELFKLREAERFLKQAIGFSQRHEIDFYRVYSTAWLALCEMYMGRWDDAAEHAVDAIEQTATLRNTSRVMALVAQGRLRTRRGEAGAAESLDEALDLALASGTLQRLAPVRAARAEAAWARGDMRAVSEEAAAGLQLALKHQHPWFAGELAFWLLLAGEKPQVPAACARPFALQMAGNWREAAQAWEELACPFEQARALSEGDRTAQLQALDIFERLGAQPAADRLRQQLKAAGQRHLPRRGRSSTRANPHQLTTREIEVLELLCEGLKNSEIAERLCRSVRTVDHHLEAVFGKLNVATRTEAVAAAARAGIRAKDGQFSPEI